jgi:hypothetical protein
VGKPVVLVITGDCVIIVGYYSLGGATTMLPIPDGLSLSRMMVMADSEDG